MDDVYTFVLTEQEANIILNALAQRPYIEVADLIAKIHQQAQEQKKAD
jgi:hypothetical protein